MKKVLFPNKNTWNSLASRPLQERASLEAVVTPVLQEVKSKGEEALLKYARLFDKFEGDNISVSAQDICNAEKSLSQDLKDAIDVAYANIQKFHLAQWEEPKNIETSKGVVCWRKSVAIEKVGFYIPGGSAPLFSTVLMLGIPARIAGCKEIVLCTPAFRGTFEDSEPEDKYFGKSSIHPAIAYCCKLLQIEKVFSVGGSQAIAAMAYGTKSVPKVDKIFGPGNQYVTIAKQLVSQDGVAIDMPAGPSEVLVIADRTANPKFVAADLLSQAEHGADSQAMLAAVSEEMIEEVFAELDEQITRLDRQLVARSALENSTAICLESVEQAIEFSNLYAPEHLILATENPRGLADKVVNAGSVFLGHYSPESAGDYASGTNHTLPTNGYARCYSGVSLDSFVKKITFQEITKQGLLELGPAVAIMAEAEQLEAHREAVNVRLRAIKNV